MTKKKTRTPGKKARTRKAQGTKRKTRLNTPHGALHLENGLGALPSARSIARSIKRAADASTTVKATSHEAAVAAINYLIRHVDAQLARLHAARQQLRELYDETLDETERRLRHVSDERVAARGTRKRGRKLDLASAATG